jgi:hypothetical protein
LFFQLRFHSLMTRRPSICPFTWWSIYPDSDLGRALVGYPVVGRGYISKVQGKKAGLLGFLAVCILLTFWHLPGPWDTAVLNPLIHAGEHPLSFRWWIFDWRGSSEALGRHQGPNIGVGVLGAFCLWMASGIQRSSLSAVHVSSTGESRLVRFCDGASFRRCDVPAHMEAKRASFGRTKNHRASYRVSKSSLGRQTSGDDSG